MKITKSDINFFSSHLIKSTIQLFLKEKANSEKLIPLGTGVLFTHNQNCYLFSCAHVLVDTGEYLPYVFTSINEIATLGEICVYSTLENFNHREYDKLDLAIVKLNSVLVQKLVSSGYIFLTENQVFTGYTISKNDYALILGRPSTRTKIKLNTKKVLIGGLKFTSRFIDLNLSKFGFSNSYHLYIKYAINSFINDHIAYAHRGPDPNGLSGGGVWAIMQTKDELPKVLLVGILTEYRKEYSAVIATKIDLFIDTINQTFDPSLKNNGVRLDQT